MPVYEYSCEKCSHTFERLLFPSDQAVHCPKCGGGVQKLMSAFSIEIPDEICGTLPKGEQREVCTECRQGGSACPVSA